MQGFQFIALVKLTFLIFAGARGQLNRPECRSYDSTTSKCLLCDFSLGYISDGQGGCKRVDRPNCKTTDVGGCCVECLTGFAKLNCLCIKVSATELANCVELANPLKCAKCAQGFYLDAQGKCISSPAPSSVAQCDWYITATTCAQCATGFILYNQQCIDSKDANCAAGSNLYCTQCDLGYKLVTKGVEFLDYLQLQGDLTKTVQYYDIATTCEPILSNCLTYDYTAGLSAPTKCLTCDTGYVLLTTGTCVLSSGVTGCAVYTTASATAATCAACVNPKILVNNQCYDTYAFGVTNCAAYTSATTCSKCDPQFYLTASNTCSPVASTVTNCYYATDSTTCAQCSAGYFLVGGVCTLITTYTANCYKLVDSGCAICDPGYVVDSGTCKAINQSTTPAAIDNCDLDREGGSCLYCETLYYWSSAESKCISPGDANCLVYSTPSVCQYCKPGYYVDNGACKQSSSPAVPNCLYQVSDNSCAGCSSGFVLTVTTSGGSTTYTCAPMTPDNCRYLQSASKCAICQRRYQLTPEFTCEPITQLIP